MDFHQEPYQNINSAPPYNRRSQKMATASMTLGIAAMVTAGCIYPALICGALGIILAQLSKGGETTLDGPGRAGFLLSILGIALGIAFFCYGFYTIINVYGSFDNFMKEYMTLYNTLTTDL